MNLAAVMDAVSARADTIAGLRCYAWPVAKVTPPALIVSYPEDITFDETYGRGMDRMTLPAVAVVGKASDRTARDLVAAYCNGSGASSVKQVLESGTYTAFHHVRVASIEFDVVSIAGVDYIAALFTLDIAGSGTS
ncbi:MAG TPA: hypothetical protein VFB74_22390 [Kribbellaceae bacterium]|nr:hypothetical protein [Kribbellaceae bacterium]